MKLTYRGQSFNVQTTASHLTQNPGNLIRTLHYLGNTYTAFLSEPSSATPRAINWRHEVPII